MLSTDRDAFICDMAETYHVLDYKALPVETLAVLASGLREDSRICMAMAGMKYVPMEILAAKCVDTLNYILHVLSAEKGQQLPSSIVDLVVGKVDIPKKNNVGFRTPAEFEAERKRLLEAMGYG